MTGAHLVANKTHACDTLPRRASSPGAVGLIEELKIKKFLA